MKVNTVHSFTLLAVCITATSALSSDVLRAIATEVSAAVSELAAKNTQLEVGIAAHAATIADLEARNARLEARVDSLEHLGQWSPAHNAATTPQQRRSLLTTESARGATHINERSINTTLLNVSTLIVTGDLVWRGIPVGFHAPTRAPTAPPTLEPTPAPLVSCKDARARGYTTTGTYTIYPGGSGSTSYTVYCDQETDGGGWMLTYAYNHPAGGTAPLVPNTIPTSPDTGYSHFDMNFLPGNAADIADVRFYCTSTTGYVIHFKPSNAVPRNIAFDGDQTGSTTTDWSTGFTLLGGHTALVLPSIVDWVGPSRVPSSTGGLWNYPFSKTSGSNHGFAMAGTTYSSGQDWFCEDWPSSSPASIQTKHLVYVRTVV